MPKTGKFGIRLESSASTTSGAGMPQPMKKLNPGASPQEWFGNELRKMRLEAGLSAVELARTVQVSDDMILRIEKGKYPFCQRDVVQRLDDFFETSGRFDWAWPVVFGNRDAEEKQPDAEQTQPDAEESSTAPGGEHVQVMPGRILGRDDISPRSGSHELVNRRTFLQAGGLAAVAPLDLMQVFAPSRPSLPDHVSSSDIDQVLAAATAISGLDNTLGGGGMVRDVAGSAMQWSAGLLQAQCSEHLRADLFAAVSRLGIVVGASAFDSYHHDEATDAFELAAECAEEAGDWHLRAKTYSFLARQAVWVDQPDDGLTYAEKGLVRSDRLTATEQAMLHTARARAFGKMGNVRETMAAVGAADEAFERARPLEDPPWMAYYDDAQHNGDTAHALFDLAVLSGQDPGRAARRFDTAVKGHLDEFKRSRAISRTKLASLVMATGDPRQAAIIGHQALDEAGRLTSRRAADDLHQLARFAAKHQKVAEATALRERIAATVSA